ncbi:hypothetical protein MGG_05100 [Pyricularia oryzae 70-15]|uniref:SCP domain-containing protein n=1 Tax=Pyricularia oryzae (strain 70-15 / ATCC MYA-4617 / FGSC 8958) TaxID=242507 RepID=G4N4E9_PYRO7|nr:uncharacterized protein MGG_05100 [Pyricularia oryzae 70-15]EHA52817.1 hypothetical protein MGG_05100 [Pyricularia oryzae 70-15]KAI7918975.1 hypothetical protein M0657_007361 [Pyricularia oryzae]KAI7930610.1 hypothetical protein M9X92_000674 [Pyricularia oryzae]
MKLLNAVAVLTAAIAPVWAQRTASEIAADKVGALNMHNVARQTVTGSRGSRANLTYSSVLDSSAANYAVELARLDNGLVHASNRNGQGENLYYTSNSDLKTPFQAASKAWLDEKPFYDCRNINGADPNFGKFGHYTQAIWRTTTEFGIGVAKGNKTGRLYVVARYLQQGNIVGQSAC